MVPGIAIQLLSPGQEASWVGTEASLPASEQCGRPRLLGSLPEPLGQRECR